MGTPSHPAKGVWIEISSASDPAGARDPSHPAKGVWIEIKTFVALPERQKVTPCKGGLKYIRYECYSLLIV